jgi:hypothetical protein
LKERTMMPHLTYCGTLPPVDDQNTQLLLLEHRAIWFPPQHQQAPLPSPDDRIWLLWRPADLENPLIVLGGGIVLPLTNPRSTTSVLHTEGDEPGLRAAANALGYGGPNNMTFLKLHNVVPCHQDITEQHWHVPAGLMACTIEQTDFLQQICPLP